MFCNPSVTDWHFLSVEMTEGVVKQIVKIKKLLYVHQVMIDTADLLIKSIDILTWHIGIEKEQCALQCVHLKCILKIQNIHCKTDTNDCIWENGTF